MTGCGMTHWLYSRPYRWFSPKRKTKILYHLVHVHLVHALTKLPQPSNALPEYSCTMLVLPLVVEPLQDLVFSPMTIEGNLKSARACLELLKDRIDDRMIFRIQRGPLQAAEGRRWYMAARRHVLETRRSGEEESTVGVYGCTCSPSLSVCRLLSFQISRPYTPSHTPASYEK